MPIGDEPHYKEESTALYVSSLNYASLKTISKVKLVWVNSLTNHLDFNATSRQLSIFRFPSYCAISTLESHKISGTYAG